MTKGITRRNITLDLLLSLGGFAVGITFFPKETVADSKGVSLTERIQELEQKVETNPTDESLVDLSDLYLKRYQSPNREKDDFHLFGYYAQEAINLNNENSEAHDNFGYYFFQHSNFRRAEQHFKEAIRFDRKNASAYNHLGLLKRSEGKLQEAVNNYKRARSIDIKNPTIFYNLGEVYFSMSGFKNKIPNLVQAIYNFGKTVEFNPKSIKAHYSLGLSYKELSFAHRKLSESYEISGNSNMESKELNKAIKFFGVAIGYFNKVVRLNPGGAYATHARNQKDNLIRNPIQADKS